MLGVFIEHCEAQWMQGEQVETGLWFAAINNQRRVLADLGLERVAKHVDDIRRFLIGDTGNAHHAPAEAEEMASEEE